MLALTREKIVTHLQDVTSLVDLYQKRDHIFVERTIIWLSDIEKTLMQLRHLLASSIAVQRGKIHAVADGYQAPNIIHRQKSKRKVIFATTLMVLCDVENALIEVVNDIDKQFSSWQEKMVQFLAVASSEYSIPLPSKEPRQQWLSEVWEKLGKTGNAQNMYIYLNTAMKPSDRLYILNNLIENALVNS